tara:strand:+ start:4623 stop:4787 length:165 start_codon:yes stop_codon:yes gene_type:complete
MRHKTPGPQRQKAAELRAMCYQRSCGTFAAIDDQSAWPQRCAKKAAWQQDADEN